MEAVGTCRERGSSILPKPVPWRCLNSWSTSPGRSLPQDIRIATLEIPDGLHPEILPPELLPKNWRSYPPPIKLAKLGNDWARSNRSLVLRVPVGRGRSGIQPADQSLSPGYGSGDNDSGGRSEVRQPDSSGTESSLKNHTLSVRQNPRCQWVRLNPFGKWIYF